MHRYIKLCILLTVYHLNCFSQSVSDRIAILNDSLIISSSSYEKINQYNELSRLFLAIDNNKSIESAQKGLNLAQNIQDSLLIIRSKYRLAKAQIEANQPAQALLNAQTVYDYAILKNLTNEKADAMVLLGSLRFNDNAQEAENLINDAKSTAKQNNYLLGAADANQLLGDIYKGKDTDRAITFWQEAALNYEKNKSYVELALLYEKMADFSKDNLKDPLKAVLYYELELQTYEKLGEKVIMVNKLQQLASFSEEQLKDYPKAANYQLQAYLISKEYQLTFDKENAVLNIDKLIQIYSNADKYYQQNKQPQIASEYKKLYDAYQTRKSTWLSTKENKLLDQNKTTNDSNLGYEGRIKFLQLEIQKLNTQNLEKNNRISVLEAARQKAYLQIQQDSIQLLKTKVSLKSANDSLSVQRKSTEELKKDNDQKTFDLNVQVYSKWMGFLIIAAISIFIIVVLLLNRSSIAKMVTFQKEKIQDYTEKLFHSERLIKNTQQVLEEKEQELLRTNEEIQDLQNKRSALKTLVEENINKPVVEPVIVQTKGMLDDSDKEFLQTYKRKLSKLEYYEVSAVKRLLAELPEGQSENILKWKEAILYSVQTLDEERFNELLANLTE